MPDLSPVRVTDTITGYERTITRFAFESANVETPGRYTELADDAAAPVVPPAPVDPPTPAPAVETTN